MSLSVYNTSTGKKERFEPLDESHVRMYVCGPTVYNRVHIGNARPVVVFDTLYRLLQQEFPKVTYARNITDIDDKIMRAAREQGESIEQLASRFADAYLQDMDALNNLRPTVAPYATQHVDEMVAMIATLIERGCAYEAERHVLFSVESKPDYGKLSNRSLEDMLAGARVEVAPYKRYAGDFVLWKPSSEEEPGWDSPWGRGRPGWHIECSAMIEKHLGDSIDIHGGGRDLIFPHHENELAQSECAHDGKQFVKYWMHNGYINIDGEKMSKSLGNFRLVADLLSHYPGEVLRFAILSAHYRSELNFGQALLEQAKASLDTLYGFLRNVIDVVAEPCELNESLAAYAALLDDMNTPVAISELHALAKAMNKANGEEQARLKGCLLAVGKVMGLLQAEPDAWFQQGESDDDMVRIEKLVAERDEAKKNKDYARADAIRTELLTEGIVLEDSRDGTKWRKS